MNFQLAKNVIQELLARGVREFCVCPGARNAPWVQLLSFHSEKLRVYYFYEERSASFFALGRIRSTGSPVAVVTTSGTAAGELLPATMEGYYSGLPLVLMTADRPRRYRGSGAPQTAEQVGIFGVYTLESWDLEGDERVDLSSASLQGPIHLNVCFDEPLLSPQGALEIEFPPVVSPKHPSPKESTPRCIQQKFLEKVKSPLILVGMLHPSEREAVAQLILEWEVPVYLEGLSGLREDPRLQQFRIHISDQIIERAVRADYLVDGVVRLGGVPTLRLWRDLDLKLSDLEVLTLSRLPFSGLGRPTHFQVGSLVELCSELQFKVRSSLRKPARNAERKTGHNLGSHLDSQADFLESFSNAPRRFLAQDSQQNHKLEELLQLEPHSEPGIMAALSKRIPQGSTVYLGNSMPVREWDLAAISENRNFDIWASRGLNGIDGQVSTFLGFAKKGTSNWGIVGDLTALYDLPGPWILNQLKDTRVNLVVINNGGGKIFDRMFPLTEFQNRHELRFKAWADLWGLQYEQWNIVPELVCDRGG